MNNSSTNKHQGIKMFANNLMTRSMLAKQLNIGNATLRFWLNRFNKWLPYIEKDGEILYQSDSLDTLKFISEKINSGMLPTEIDSALDDKTKNEQNKIIPPSLNSFIPSLQSVIQDVPNSSRSMNQSLQVNDSIQLISALFEKFYDQQERIVAAQERKAAAEERKAEAEEKKAQAEMQKAEAEKIKAEAEQQKTYAFTKRAEAELHKANAMNNLADAIKNISADFLKSLPLGNIFSESQSSTKLASEQMFNTLQVKDEEFSSSHHITNDDEVRLNNEIDDLSAFIEDEEEKLNDLSALIDEEEDYEDNKIDDLSALIKDEEEKLDDLSALIEVERDYKDNKIDDLSSLIEDEEEKLDDLSALIEVEGDYEDNRIDDLSSLIENEDALHNDLKPDILDSDVDDLMSLIDDDPDSVSNDVILDNNFKENDIVDDLSALIDEDVSNLRPAVLDSDVDDLMSLIVDDKQDDIMDDLSVLLDGEEESLTPKIEKPKASLENNFEQYKTEVINIIIKLRKDGYTVEQTTEILNNEEIKPLSGKNRWTTKMIAKIYTFIEAAKK
ncbi:MAG: MerR family transcriptional regulator [Desulfamplus sp.]|nr:MerR family transcriptional regulator [Desulfamplus sp.]